MKKPFLRAQLLTRIEINNATDMDYQLLDNAMQSAAFVPLKLQRPISNTVLYTKSGTWSDISNTAYRILTGFGKGFQLNICPQP
jgi:hypothetical protein